MSRSYPFEFPVKLSGLALAMAPGQLDSHGIWYALPVPLCEKINQACTGWGGELELNQTDLDDIDDETWAKLLELVGPYLTK